METLATGLGLPREACESAIRALRRDGLVVQFDAGPGKSMHSYVSLTEIGRAAARKSHVLPSRGSVPEFSQGLDRTSLLALNATAEEEMKNAGGMATRSHLRTVLRRDDPALDIGGANAVIDALVGSFLTSSGGREPSYHLNIAGLLASSWGQNALQIVEQLRYLLRRLKTDDPALFRYSWSTVRESLGLSRAALNLTHLSIDLTRLGRGMFRSEGDRWWSTPPELDLALEAPTAREFLRDLISVESPSKVRPQHSEAKPPPSSGADSPESASESLVARVASMLEPSSNPAVRLQEAFDRLPLHPSIYAASEKLFRMGQYRHAVLDAGIALVNYVKEKSGRRDIDGVSLVHTVLAPSDPTLAFNARKTRFDNNEQEGLMMLFVGAVQAFRNPRAHGLDPDAPEEALETIAFMSLLAKRLDRAKRRRVRRKRGNSVKGKTGPREPHR